MLTDKNTVADMIRSGKTLMLSGSEELLAGLPHGNWVGGTSAYFMDKKDGGQKNLDKIFAMEMPADAKLEQIKFYDSDHLPDILLESPDNGFTYLLIPFGSKSHFRYAEEAPSYPDQFMKITIGWITGIALEDFGKKTAKVFNGQNGQASDADALAMHCSLPKSKYAEISIVNVYEGDQSAIITFPKSGFDVSDCLIDGEPANIVKYIQEKGIDIKNPMVADYAGTYVNVSFAGIKEDIASLYAPVFPDIRYHFAKPVNDYIADYHKRMPAVPSDLALSFSCILIYTNANLEGKITDGMYGPFTFGEIAYQLLNQTLVYLEIKTHK